MRIDCKVLYQKIDTLADEAIENYKSTSDHYFEGAMDAYGTILTVIEELERGK